MARTKISGEDLQYYFSEILKRVGADALKKFYITGFNIIEFQGLKNEILNKDSKVYKELKGEIKSPVLLSFVSICKKGSCKGKENVVENILDAVFNSKEDELYYTKLKISSYRFIELSIEDSIKILRKTTEKMDIVEYKKELGDDYQLVINSIMKGFKKSVILDYKQQFISLFNLPEESINEILDGAIEGTSEEKTVSDDDSKEEKVKKDKSDNQLKKEIAKQNSKVSKLELEVDSLKKENKAQAKEYEKRIKELEELNNKHNKDIADAIESKYKKDNKKLKDENEKLKNELGDYEYKYNQLKEKIDIESSKLEENKVIIDDKVDEKKFIDNLDDALRSAALSYRYSDLLNFHIACKSSMLNILAGPSGTGKTRLPLMYAEAINCRESDGTLLFLPVSPSFTEPSDVLGFYSSQDNKFHPSDTGLTEFLISAMKNKDKRMYMVIFDEMNLSQIEYWFAPFLSVLEKPDNQKSIRLYSSSVTPNNSGEFPDVINIYDNLIFIGTINLDETTKDLSDRLIDRAIIINLVKPTFMEHWAATNNDYDVTVKLDSQMTYLGYKSMRVKEPIPYNANLFEDEINFFDELHKEIQKLNPSKGVSFRNVKKICFYLEQASSLVDDNYTRELFFDIIFSQTILKKINGYDDSIKSLLGKLNDKDEIVDSILINIFNNNENVSDFSNSRNEIKKKIKEFNNYGFTR